MTTFVVPYHQDERLSDDHLPLPADRDPVVLDPDLPAGDLWPRLVALYDAVAGRVAAAVPDGLTTVVSGDCLITLGSLAGAQRAGFDPALIWFDAHGDVHTLETSTSGYLGGLSLRLALGAHADRVAGPLGLRPLPPGRAVLVDGRDLDPAEADYLAGTAIRRSSVTALDATALPPGPLVLHIDLDVIDPGELPGMLFPAAGGPSGTEVLTAARRVLATGRVCVLSLAGIWHPAAGAESQAVRAGMLAAFTSASFTSSGTDAAGAGAAG